MPSDLSFEPMPAVARQPSKLRNRTLWTLQIVAALFFFAAAASKFAGVEYNVVVFDKIGLGQWFRYFTACVETLGAILLLVPGRAAWGALLLCATMIGAAIAEVTRLGGNGVFPLVVLALVGCIAWFRRTR